MYLFPVQQNKLTLLVGIYRQFESWVGIADSAMYNDN